jgi:SAM-dependent methyltransferase
MSILKPVTSWIKQRIKEEELKNCAEDEVVRFSCNICGYKNIARLTDLGRDNFTCVNCYSSVRMRTVAYLLAMELYQKPSLLPDMPENPAITGIGLSDPAALAAQLSQRFNYQNTYFHKQPGLDITQIDESRANSLDFLISSDVFEHVAPPVERAFENSYRLIKPGGCLILTVPFHLDRDLIEHFPNLYDYKIVENQGKYTLFNTTKDGNQEVFDQLVFHGGPGVTLEMRFFSMSSLLSLLDQAGFDEVVFSCKNYLPFGIYWPYYWSLPVVARKKAVV